MEVFSTEINCLTDLVMEQTDTCKAHCHIVFVAGINDMIITNGSARLSHIFYAALVCTLNIVAKWEECVRSQCNICVFIQSCTFFFCCKYRWFYFKDILPCAICKHIHVLISDVKIDRIVTICTFNAIYKLKI